MTRRENGPASVKRGGRLPPDRESTNRTTCRQAALLQNANPACSMADGFGTGSRRVRRLSKPRDHRGPECPFGLILSNPVEHTIQLGGLLMQSTTRGCFVSAIVLTGLFVFGGSAQAASFDNVEGWWNSLDCPRMNTAVEEYE